MKAGKDVVAVGHLPHLPAVAGALCAEPAMAFELLPTAGALVLQRDDDGLWTLWRRFSPEG